MAPPVIKLLSKNYGEVIYLYEFRAVGDELALHNHSFMHRAMICPGSQFEWFTTKHKGEVVGPAVLTFPAGVQHGLRALSAGSSCFIPMPET